MSEYYKIGRRVDVIGKNVQGVIAFYGQTNFGGSGKWIGVILDEPQGKNNGSLRGIEYFKCAENCGLFVRPDHITPLDASGKPVEMKPAREMSSTGIARPKTRQSSVRRKTSPQKLPPSLSTSSSRLSLASSQQSLAGSRTSLSGSKQSLTGSRSHLASPVAERMTDTGEHSQIPKRSSFVEVKNSVDL